MRSTSWRHAISSRLSSGSTTPGGGGFSNTVRIPIGATAAATRIVYLAFLVDTLKPRIDRFFRTRRERDATAILGSSMGGLLSLYGFFRYPSVFGRAGVMSPSIWYGQAAILDFIGEAQTPTGRLYVDVGTAEGAGTLRDARRLGRLLVRKGFRRERRGPGRRASASRRASDRAVLRYLEDQGGRHSEADWARRVGPALEFLLG